MRSNRSLKFSTPTAFMAQEKNIIDTAYPGDIIGLHDTGNLQIGDTLSEGELIHFKGIPTFSPEIFRMVINEDPLKSKQLTKGLEHLCEEGVAQFFTKLNDTRRIVGVVGPLQFEIIQYRLKHEYGAQCRFEPLSYSRAVWIESDDPKKLSDFIDKVSHHIAKDSHNHFVYLAETQGV